MLEFGIELQYSSSVPPCYRGNSTPLGVSYRGFSQWQQISDRQGGFKEKERPVPAADTLLCTVPAGESGTFTFVKVLGRQSAVAV